MSLKAKLQEDLNQAMKNKNEAGVSAIRLLKTSIMKFETSGAHKEATDEEILQIIAKEIKQRRDSIDQYEKGNRPDLAVIEKAEIIILEKYLPPQMSEEEVRAIVKEAVAATGASSKADIGKLMGAVMPKVKGKADGGMVNRIVQELLK